MKEPGNHRQRVIIGAQAKIEGITSQVNAGQNLQAAAPTPDMTPDRSLRTTLEQLANHLATDREPDQC